MKFNVKEMDVKTQKLKQAGDNLKKHFVGNDEIIDKMIREIEFWYVCPELLRRPPIICLWGMTGVGKTDLVRRLVVELELDKKYLEIQMTNKGSGNSVMRENSISGMLSGSSINEEEQGILLLDEMQRFRTVEDGKEIHDYKYQDVWTLLSDGKFSKQAKDIEAEICGMIFEQKIDIDHDEVRRKNAELADDEDDEDDEDDDDRPSEVEAEEKKKRHQSRFVQWRYFAIRLKETLNLDEELVEIAQWSNYKVLEVLQEKLQDKSLYQAKDYSKLLIFISGNLDEVYSNAHNVEEVDLDADIFHEITKKITIVSVKKALKERFKPEQIARFGNVHIIYPSISKKNYEIIIGRCCTDLIENFKEVSGVTITMDQSVHDFVYRNAVFPLQGTRPVFSTIFSLINNNLTKMVYFGVRKKCKTLSVSYDSQKLTLTAKCKKKVITLPCEGDVDKIKRQRRETNSDRKFSTIVHEVGHSVVYTKLFGYVPRSIAIETASDDFNGFIYPESLVYTKENLKKELAVLLAGRVAEQVIFGDAHITTGAQGDFRTATNKASNMIRHWMMFERQAQIVPLGSTNGDHSSFSHDSKGTDTKMEELLLESAKLAEKTLIENIDVFRQLIVFIQENKKVNAKEIKVFYDSIGVESKVLGKNSVIKSGIEDTYRNFISGELEIVKVEDRMVADTLVEAEVEKI